ncbi:MAG: tetratricopeptide repeat protein [Bacteroidales bacterium]|nr:tetratricopeptide repeat protein [Bacteroidales bacterium]MCF8404318.1 tetratricopeptide repeat protein [Bacteroidales bacterium]
MAKKKDTAEERIVAVEEALSKTEQFIENNQKVITWVVGALIVVVLIFFGYRKFIQLPKENAAQMAIFPAQNYFEQDSIDLALFGDGENYGFVDVADEYSSTDAGNLAKYYAGICYLQKNEYETAIDYLKKFSSSDLLLPSMALGAIGDAYMQLGEINKAIDYYLDAASKNANDFTGPTFLVKAGWAYEINQDYKDAIEVYTKIKKEYPTSREAREIEKYIDRAKAHTGEL